MPWNSQPGAYPFGLAIGRWTGVRHSRGKCSSACLGVRCLGIAPVGIIGGGLTVGAQLGDAQGFTTFTLARALQRGGHI